MSHATVALVATTAIQIAAAAAALTLPAIAPVVARDLAVPTSMVGTYIALLYVGSSTAALAGGGIVLRIGAIRLSQLCLLACAGGLALGLAPALGAVAVAAVLVGLGYGPITPASSHVLAKTTPREKMALTFSIKQTGVPAGTALAGLVVPPLAVAFGWHAAVLAVACALLAFAAALGATAIGWNGVYLAEVARLAPAGTAGLATGGCLFFTFVGVVVCPYLFGVLQRATDSYAPCFAVAAAVCALAAAALALSGRVRAPSGSA